MTQPISAPAKIRSETASRNATPIATHERTVTLAIMRE
jgi:hypothetical protein